MTGPPALRQASLVQQAAKQLGAPTPAAGVRWLVATPSAAADVRSRLAAALSSEGCLVAGVVTIRQAAEAVVRNRLPACLPLGPATKRALIGELAATAEHRSALGPLEELIESPGLIDFLASRFRELRREGVGPDEANGALLRTDGRRTASVLARLYKDYLRALEQHDLLDDEGIVLAATEELSRPAAPPSGGLIIDLPVAQTEIDRGFVVALSRRYLHFTVSLPCPAESSDRLVGAEALFRSWSEALIDGDTEFPKSPPSATTSSPAGLRAVRERLFDETHPAASSADGVRVIAGAGRQDTARRVMRRIKQLLSSGQARPDEILLAAPRLEDTAPRYAEAAAEYGVPIAIDLAPKLGEASACTAALALLTLADNDWSFEAVLAALGRQDLPELDAAQPPAGFSSPRAAAEWFARELQIPSGRAYLQRQAEQLAARGAGSERVERLAAAADAAIGVFERLGEAVDCLADEATPLGWYDAIDLTLRRLGHPGLGAAPGASDRAAGDALEEACASLENLAHWRDRKPRQLHRKRMRLLLEAWSTRLRLPTRGEAEGRVRILGTTTAVGVMCKRLFVVGADETSFSGPDPDEAMLFFSELASLPTENLTFAYAALDESAQPLAPSPYVSDVERLFEDGATRIDNEPLLAPPGVGDSPASAREARTEAVRQATSGQQAALGALGSVALLDSLSSVNERSRGDTFGAWEGVLSGAKAQAALVERYGPEHLWSASQLELMATCPYKFFSRQVLRMAPVGELTLSADYRRRGSLMHDALAECLTAIVEELPPGKTLREVPPDELSARLAQRIDALADIGKLPAHEAALLAIEARQATDWASRYAGQQQAFDQQKRWSILDTPLTPTLLEARFGPATGGEGAEDSRSTDEPFELVLPGGETMLVTGRIDRIDAAQVGDQTLFTVVDYKTSKEYKSSRELMESGKQLQPVLYALAAEELFFENEAVPVAAGYWAVRKKGFVAPKDSELPLFSLDDGRVLPSEAWQDVVSTVRRRCEEIVREVRTGSFPMHNDDDHCGQMCEFRTVCRVGHARSVGKLPAGEAAQP